MFTQNIAASEYMKGWRYEIDFGKFISGIAAPLASPHLPMRSDTCDKRVSFNINTMSF